MTQKICFDCFHKLFPDKPIRKVTLGRQCVVCKAQTDRTEQMIPVEAEDIPLVKQIAQVPRRVLHRTERHADRRIAVRVAARGAGQVGRDAGHILHRRWVATDGHYGLLTPQASLVMSLCPQERGRVVAASCCGGRAGCLVSPHFLFRG
jgi:hypothetical protein